MDAAVVVAAAPASECGEWISSVVVVVFAAAGWLPGWLQCWRQRRIPISQAAAAQVPFAFVLISERRSLFRAMKQRGCSEGKDVVSVVGISPCDLVKLRSR